MPHIPAGRSYRIRNKASKLYLNIEDYSLGDSAWLELWHLQTDHRRPSQVWHVFPLDFGKYMLVNKASGLMVNIRDNSTAPSARVEQYHSQPASSKPAQEWLLRDASDGALEIVNDKSQLLMGVVGRGTSPSDRIEQWTRISGSAAATQQWLLEVEDEYKPVLTLPKNSYVGDIHRMKSYEPTPSATTEPVQVAAMAYPFPLVKDPAYDRRRQSRECPYCILRRFSHWERVYSYEHGGASDYTNKKNVTVGLTTTNAKAVEETTGISVTAEAGFAFDGISTSLSATASHELKITTTQQEVQTHSTEVSIERRYFANKRVTEAIWYRSDRYVLERLDGSVVLEWTTRDPDTAIADAYPLPG